MQPWLLPAKALYGEPVSVFGRAAPDMADCKRDPQFAAAQEKARAQAFPLQTFSEHPMKV